MEQPFEHLSDAQIEHYGEEIAGAGPDQNEKLEAHLADCPGCRIRVLAFHRARFTPGSTHESMTESSFSTVRRPDCPPEDDLRSLAAGLTPPDQATQLIQHAAQCDHCGHILSMYTEDFSDDLSAEDQALLAQLKSASPKWQKKLVRDLQSAGACAGTALPSHSRFKLPWFRWLLVPATAAACAAIAFFVWYSQLETPQKVEKLLAQAYTEQRTMEMRIPYAAHADFKQVRSGETASLLSSPEALRKAADSIAARLKKNPDDPQWLILSARLDLLDWRYQSALSTLNKIDDRLEDSHEFRMTRSLALYEKAEIEHDPQSYGAVVDLMGKILQKTPDDSVALFNQAVACEKLYMYECATGDYERFLKIDPDSGWASEAREHLNRIKEKKSPER